MGGGEVSASEYVVFVCKLLPREIISALRGRILRPSGGGEGSETLLSSPPPKFDCVTFGSQWLVPLQRPSCGLFIVFLVRKYNLAKKACVSTLGLRCKF